MTSSIPYVSLFFSTMTLGTLMTLSANQWLYIWMGLELNLLSFVPLITSNSTHRESEAAMKYFLAQAMGSGMLLLGAFSNLMFTNYHFISASSSFFILFALLIKLGAAPCHFWFPAVMSNISWPLCMILSTWQKIAPLMVLSYSNSLNQSTMILTLAALGSMTGGIGGLNQTQMRPLLAYSSIGHLGWMISTPSFTNLFLYLIIYISMTLSIMLMMWKLSAKHWSFNLSMLKTNPALTTSMVIMLFSLAGLPPFIGFLPKWMILTSLTSSSLIWPLILITGSVIQLFYYISLMFSFYMKTFNYTLPISLHSSSTSQLIGLAASITLGLSPLCLLICAMTLLN